MADGTVGTLGTVDTVIVRGVPLPHVLLGVTVIVPFVVTPEVTVIVLVFSGGTGVHPAGNVHA